MLLFYPPSDRCVCFVMSAWLWLFLVALLVLPVLLRFYAEDGPRSDEPPDTSSRAALLAAS